MQKNLILASTSPRRQELLKQVGIDFSVKVSDIDESNVTIINPVEKVQQLAYLKGKSVHTKHDNEIILSADTIVVCNNIILSKPSNKEAAYDMIRTLSGHKHEVYTGVAIRSALEETVFVEKTEVQFWPLEDKEIARYIEADEPYDKAGGYGIQGMGALFVKRIIGDYYNVVGLPLSRTVRELRSFGME